MGRRSRKLTILPAAATPAPNQIAASIPRFGYTERPIATATPKDCPGRRDAARTQPAQSLPSRGHGHVYAPAHYIDAWINVTDVRNWSPADIARLKHHLSKP
jgi:hypothetical protein